MVPLGHAPLTGVVPLGHAPLTGVVPLGHVPLTGVVPLGHAALTAVVPLGDTALTGVTADWMLDASAGVTYCYAYNGAPHMHDCPPTHKHVHHTHTHTHQCGEDVLELFHVPRLELARDQHDVAPEGLQRGREGGRGTTSMT